MKKNLIIVGAREHAKVLVAILEECYADTLRLVGYLDDNPALAGTELLGYPVLGRLADLERLVQEREITAFGIGISNRFMTVRQRLFEQAKAMGLEVPSLIHSRAYVSPRATIGEGVILNPGVVINCFATLGNNIVIYSNATIEHEGKLADNTYIGPCVGFASNVRVGTGTFIGAGSNAIPDVVIGSRVIAGAGTAIISNVPDDSTVVGVPGRVIKRSSESTL